MVYHGSCRRGTFCEWLYGSGTGVVLETAMGCRQKHNHVPRGLASWGDNAIPYKNPTSLAVTLSLIHTLFAC